MGMIEQPMLGQEAALKGVLSQGQMLLITVLASQGPGRGSVPLGLRGEWQWSHVTLDDLL